MNQLELLQQIAIDVAVIKAEIENIKKGERENEETSKQVIELKSQMKVAKWLGGTVGTGVLSLWVVKLKDLFV